MIGQRYMEECWQSAEFPWWGLIVDPWLEDTTPVADLCALATLNASVELT